jgi:hypothetical protein
MSIDDNHQFRKVSLVHNRKNNRKLGKGGPGAPIQNSHHGNSSTCKFGFVIKCDQHGYYVNLERRAGEATHSGHPCPINPKLLSHPTRLMSKEEKRDARHAMDAQSSKAAGRNFIFGKFGKYISNIKIAYLSSASEDANLQGKCDIASMLETFKASDEIRCMSLSDIPVEEYFEQTSVLGISDKHTNGKTVTVSLTKNENSDIVSKDVRDSKTLSPIEDIAQQEQLTRHMLPNDILFISVAWIVIPVFDSSFYAQR